MFAVPLKQVEMLRGVLWLTKIERAEALATGKWNIVVNKDQVIARLEQRLAELERQAEDEIAFELLLQELDLPIRGHIRARDEMQDLPA
jgi:hypothetical protein